MAIVAKVGSTSEQTEHGRTTVEQDPSLTRAVGKKNLRRMGDATLRRLGIPIRRQVGRSVIRPPRRILDFDRLAGQFLPRLSSGRR